MSTEATELGVLEARERLRRARAEVDAALQLLKSHGRRRRGGYPVDEFPRSAIMRAAATREGRIALAAAVLGVLAVRPGLIPVIWRLGRVAPVLPLLRALLNRYLVRRNARYE